MLTCRHTAGGFDPVEMPWCGAREAESLTLTLALGDVGSPFWPEPFRAIYTVVFAQTLSLRLAVQNRATEGRGRGSVVPRAQKGDVEEPGVLRRGEPLATLTPRLDQVQSHGVRPGSDLKTLGREETGLRI